MVSRARIPRRTYRIRRRWYFDAHVVSYLELRKQPHTGCNPRGLTLARDKALTKKILAYHCLKAPEFAIFAKRRATKRPEGLALPSASSSTPTRRREAAMTR